MLIKASFFLFLSRVKHSERVQQSKLLLSSTSALCKFYPQLEVSTHRPKINTLQLVYVLYCKRDTQFILTEDTFSLYLQYSMVCCRAQHVRPNKAATYLLHYRWVTGLLSNQFILTYPFLWCHRDMLSCFQTVSPGKFYSVFRLNLLQSVSLAFGEIKKKCVVSALLTFWPWSLQTVGEYYWSKISFLKAPCGFGFPLSKLPWITIWKTVT